MKFEDGEEVKSVKRKHIIGGDRAEIVKSDGNDDAKKRNISIISSSEDVRHSAKVVKPAQPPKGGCTVCWKDNDHGNILLCDGCDAVGSD